MNVGKKTIIFHEWLTGEFIKQKYVSSRDNKNSKSVCNRTESNLMNESTAISTNNQNIFQTQLNRKYFSTYTDAYKSNTNYKDSHNQDQYNVKKISLANPSKFHHAKWVHVIPRIVLKLKKNLHSPEDLQKQSRSKITKFLTDMIPSETLQCKSPTRYSVSASKNINFSWCAHK